MVSLFKSKKALQEEWKNKTIDYAKKVNAFVARGLRDGWENVGPEPEDMGREKLVPYLIEAIRKANNDKKYAELRDQWPLAHGPLIPFLGKNGQSIPDVVILDDGRIIARIGTAYQQGYVVEINGEAVKKLNEVDLFGKCPNKRFFAYTRKNGIATTDGWLGKEVTLCRYPNGLEGMPPGFAVKPLPKPPVPTKLIPFPDGRKVLYVSEQGIFVSSENEVVRLLPTTEQITQHFSWLQEEYPEDELNLNLSMQHGAVSHDGKLIAIGSQDSYHLVFNDRYEMIGEVGNLSEYPHYAIFNMDDTFIAFNSCHFYNGTTLGISTSQLPGLKTNPYEEDEKITILDENARVYAGVARENEFIIGDANGYIRAFGFDGKPRWQHFIGSSIGDIDISKDGTTLICSTYAGFLSILKLDGKSADYEIGTGGHTEVRRWIFWKGENQPLIW